MQRTPFWLAVLYFTTHLVTATPLAAQSPPDSAPGHPLTTEGRNSSRSGQRTAPSRDSLKNGAVIGALIGAASLGILGATLCYAYQEEGGASCVPNTLRFAAIGAGIGAGAGVVVDVARSHRAVTVRLAIRFSD
jgi:hypothetical protein